VITWFDYKVVIRLGAYVELKPVPSPIIPDMTSGIPVSLVIIKKLKFVVQEPVFYETQTVSVAY